MTYANLMATFAVFIALGGSSYAAITITGKNVKNSSLTGKDVKNSSLTGKDVKNSSLTTSDVKNRSLLSADFKTGQLPAGPQGGKGDKGDTGPPGPTVASVSSGLDPSASSSFYSVGTITTTQSGKILVQGSVSEFSLACNSGGGCNVDLGLRLDGSPIPGSGLQPFTGAVSTSKLINATTYGLSASVPAGPHTFSLQAVPGGFWQAYGGSHTQTSAIALGG